MQKTKTLILYTATHAFCKGGIPNASQKIYQKSPLHIDKTFGKVYNHLILQERYE